MEFNYHIEGGDFNRAGDASSAIKKVLKQLNIHPLVARRAVLALYEGEVNIVAHAYSGNMQVIIDSEKIFICLADRGPGIPDIQKAMKAGFSTASRQVREMGFGAGMGLPNMKKNTDALELVSVEKTGTTVKMTIYLK